METEFKKQSFITRLKSMLRIDMKRLFTMPLVYIMTGVCFVLPVLILVMTTVTGGPAGGSATDAGAAADAFTNVWQAIGSVGGGGTGMDLTVMCNINLLYFLVAVLVCVFVADDFRSGFAKNLFSVRSKKTDYVISKSLVTFVGAAIMFVVYLIGAMIGGAIAGLSFDTAGFGAGGIAACMVSKIFLTAVFVAIGVLLGAVAKQRLWLSIVGSFAAGMLLFTVIPIAAPLNAGFLNVLTCFAGGALFAAGLGAIGNLILNKTNLV